MMSKKYWGCESCQAVIESRKKPQKCPVCKGNGVMVPLRRDDEGDLVIDTDSMML